MRRALAIAMVIGGLGVTSGVSSADAVTGRLVWEYHPPKTAERGEFIQAVAPTADGGMLALVTVSPQTFAVRRLDAQGKRMWEQTLPPVADSMDDGRLRVLPNGDVAVLYGGERSAATIRVSRREPVVAYPRNGGSADPYLFFPDGGVALNCGYWDKDHKVIPCISRHDGSGGRNWLWQDRDWPANAFARAMAPRPGGGVAVLVTPAAGDDANSGRVDSDPHGQQWLLCLEPDGRPLGKVRLDTPMLHFDMAPMNRRIVLAGWAGKPGGAVRITVFDGAGCRVMGDHDGEVPGLTGEADRREGRFLVPEKGYLLFALSEPAFDDTGAVPAHTFLAAVGGNGTLWPLALGLVLGNRPAIAADGSRLLTIDHDRVLEYQLPAARGAR